MELKAGTDLKGRKLVLIGGGGLIGSHTVDRLLAEDPAEILIYGSGGSGAPRNLKQALKDPRVKLFGMGGDVMRRDMLAKALEGADTVFHFAALWLLQCHEFPEAAFEVNVEGSFNVMEACVRQGVRKLVFSSSRSLYGDAIEERIDEDHPLASENLYGATKIAAEAMLRAFHHRYGLDYATLRYFNVYGPRQAYRGPYINVIMKMLNALDEGRGPTIMGDGSEAFDFVAVEDCALANVRAAKSDATDRAYNVATGKATSLRELAELLIELTGSQAEINYLPRSAATSVRSSVGSPHRAAAEMGFTAEVPLREGLERLIAWRKADMADGPVDRLP
ncbi:MAG: NAD-dependent epimerase/dehydratase family protein [Alphaproteobacteria bacterium]|nr:MAG: NAD-dependent epimerase/dehydratase family protein [Alphaproteobacteria bacterium]